jgi:hypothetical protein
MPGVRRGRLGWALEEELGVAAASAKGASLAIGPAGGLLTVGFSAPRAGRRTMDFEMGF